MNTNSFQLRHIGPSNAEQEKMLATIKANSLEDLINETVPDNIRLKNPLDLEPAMTEYQYLAHIKELSEKMTTLVISQKISTIKDMDKIIVLDNKGRLSGFGTHEELLKSSEVYYEIALSQVGNGGGANE